MPVFGDIVWWPVGQAKTPGPGLGLSHLSANFSMKTAGLAFAMESHEV